TSDPCLFVPVKNSLDRVAEAIAFRREDKAAAPGIRAAHVEWKGTSDTSAQEAVEAYFEKGSAKVKSWLKRLLEERDECVPVTAVKHRSPPLLMSHSDSDMLSPARRNALAERG